MISVLCRLSPLGVNVGDKSYQHSARERLADRCGLFGHICDDPSSLREAGRHTPS